MNDSAMSQKYIKTPRKKDRIDLLEKGHQTPWLPLAMAEDLMCLDLDPREHIGILSNVESTNRLALEDFLTRGILQWDQNIASVALRIWAKRTDHLLWHRTLPLTRDPRITQRVSYTLLDLSWYGAGRHYIDSFIDLRGLEGISPAFLSLLFERAIQWNIEDPRLINLAKGIAYEKVTHYTGDQTLATAVAYITRFKPEILQDDIANAPIAGFWPDLIRSMRPIDTDFDRAVTKFLSKPPKKDFIRKWLQQWPRAWERHTLKAETVAETLNALAKDATIFGLLGDESWKSLAGITASTMIEAVLSLEDDMALVHSIRLLGGLIGIADEARLGKELSQRAKSGRLANTVLKDLPLRYRLWLGQEDLDDATVAAISFERAHDLEAQTRDVDDNHNERTYDPSQFNFPKALDSDTLSRREFFNRSYCKLQTPNLSGDGVWRELAEAWDNPQEAMLESLTNKARQCPPVFQIAYINTLERFKGIDKAALKLLDFIRSPDDDILRAVVRALGNIGTGRARQELVAFLTRPNVSLAIQMEIAQHLQEMNTADLQNELRSALKDLNIEAGHDRGMALELREILQGLLKTDTVPSPTISMKRNGSSDAKITTEELDEQLNKKISHYDMLSSEVKRALRTAQFFHINVEASNKLQTIDLSPVIDMQYKALELLFRESFEDPCTWVIRNGIIQRKLDYIGYARPVLHAMDDFEKYIESLPIVNTIPFFSRFKLRKMLRALCQYRPGKRFTLDGLKAFAIFFICFSRKTCNHGLQNLFPIPNYTDQQLFEFCKSLHVMQDFRNRAAHEGFHPDASNDIAGTWQQSSEIIARAFEIREAVVAYLRIPDRMQEGPRPPTIIEKKAG